MSGKAMDIVKPTSNEEKFDQAVNNFKAQHVAAAQDKRNIAVTDVEQHYILFKTVEDLDQAIQMLFRNLTWGDVTPQVSRALGKLHDAFDQLRAHADFIERTQP